MTKIFDLNIEDVLENWEPYHAIHEAAHASSGATDATRRFESKLTQYLGSCADEAIGDSG